ncbi:MULTISPECIES: ATP-binding cassette domain-containing protein [Glutamicibacter]|uniref:Multidrug ABC transporter ATP-binding protein n=1 Tax=Glutamicibacter soli TaxID=453836 RepID=A0A365YEE7_9MICC|nr:MULTISPECIES: ATP-binding cassette domain-containing protein [Glutamicibacter]QRQ78651.1 ATP-binding cassette domain-containing protein [Glutamicibacter protophormiae]RBM01075.1 multidrug ABC transporter ATP-binding protein [Glutamicibacter soli]WPR64736.1 ATP-binding cassette domain-containing protein [Glutamicibacter protophormiae]WPR68232.1 ATP-binding cassette domain-containing protein [Glutamicibacter protophormiae]
MIQVQELTKNYGAKTVVDHASFTVQPGIVTGFLGPNGAGKSTTMRMIVGLANPTRGQVLVNGKNFKSSTHPLTEVGTLLEAKSVHKSLTPRSHLRAMAATAGLGKSRVDEVLELTGLGPVQRKKVGGFSLGMGQRLGIATALLGDPQVLILDEPVNGLDPEGVAWVRNLARQQAAAGKTVFISSHLMSEMAQTADHLIVIGKGRIMADAPISEFIDNGLAQTVVRARDIELLMNALAAEGVQLRRLDATTLEVTGPESEDIGRRALEAGIVLSELRPLQRTLEDAYMELTRDAIEYRSQMSNDNPAGK